MFSDSLKKRLVICDKDGNYKQQIELSSNPWSLSVINDNDVAVSYHQHYIEIINISTRQVKNKIETSGEPLCVAYKKELLYVVIVGGKIEVLNLNGELTRSFSCPVLHVGAIVIGSNRMFLNEDFKPTVYCCNLDGVVIWRFTNDKIKFPIRLTTDEYGDVFVTSQMPANVVVVSSDGQQYKELLTQTDGLQMPTGIHYDKSSSCLLVCNLANGHAFLYDVKYSPKCQ